MVNLCLDAPVRQVRLGIRDLRIVIRGQFV